MKKLALIVSSAFSLVLVSQAAVINLQNINTASDAAYGLFNSSGTLIPVATADNIRFGYFSVSDVVVLADWASGGLSDLDANFVDFGSPTSMSLADGVFAGSPTAGSIPFTGQNMYIYASTGSNFTSASNQYLIYKFNAVFQTEPWTGGQAFLGTDAGTLLVGGFGNFSHDYGLGGGSLPGYNTVAVVPEPTTWALLAGSSTTLMIMRKRRKAQRSTKN